MYQQAWQKITDSFHIAILSHLHPDGDTLGSALALYPALKQMGKKVTLVNHTEELPQRLDFLPNFSKIKNSIPENADLIIAVDAGTPARLGLEEKKHFIINIDHHISNTRYGDINIIDEKAPSATCVVYRLLTENGIRISKEQATCLYTGLATDSGFFQYEGIGKETFLITADLIDKGADPHHISQMLNQRQPLARIRLMGKAIDTLELYHDAKIAMIHVTQEMMKSCGATLSDTEEIANMARSLVTVEVAVFLREESSREIKVSLRSKSSLNVNAIAQQFGGGGHIRAAGINFKEEGINIASIKQTLLPTLKKELNAPAS